MDNISRQADSARLALQALYDHPRDHVDRAFKTQCMIGVGMPSEWSETLALIMHLSYKQFRLGADVGARVELLDGAPEPGIAHVQLTTLEDVVDVGEDAQFSAIVAELPAILQALRARWKRDGYAALAWPLHWRPGGALGVLAARFPDMAAAQALADAPPDPS